MKIVKTTKKNIQEFSDAEWSKLDIPHYGKPTKWIEKEFWFKLTDKDKIIGIATGDLKAGVIYIEELIILKEYRGKDFGEKLINKIISYGIINKAHKIYLFTGANWPANSFYQKLGFKKTGTLINHYLNHDYIIYEKFLL